MDNIETFVTAYFEGNMSIHDISLITGKNSSKIWTILKSNRIALSSLNTDLNKITLVNNTATFISKI